MSTIEARETPQDGGSTPPRVKILAFIKAYSLENGSPPSVREIGVAVGLSSTSTVAHHLNQLEREGRLRRSGSKHRSRPLSLADVVACPTCGRVVA